jgi:hypothetical protein
LNELESGPNPLEDPTMFFPIAGCLLCVPSLIFNFKKLKTGKEPKDTNENLLDFDLSMDSLSESGSPKTSLTLWIMNLIFGLYIFAIGLVLMSFAVRPAPYDSQFDILFSVLLTSVVLFTGGAVIVLGRKR